MWGVQAVPGHGDPGGLITHAIEQCTVVSRWWIVVLLKNITHSLNGMRGRADVGLVSETLLPNCRFILSHYLNL